nr:uncharacterized protein LOC126524994 isoform X1 [Dermacentor andersoni]
MEQFKVCGIFAGLAICVLTALGSWSRPALELKGRRWPIFQMVPENDRRITRTCRYIARGRLKEIRNKPDGTHCNKSPFVSEGVCFHGLCVGSYTEVSATELAQNKSTETQEIPVKCSEYKRNNTGGHPVSDCAFRCKEGEVVFMVQEQNWLPCRSDPGKSGRCVEGICWAPLPLIWIPRNEENNSTERTPNEDSIQSISTKISSSTVNDQQHPQMQISEKRTTTASRGPYVVFAHFAKKFSTASRVKQKQYRHVNLVRLLPRNK